jgi:hypothetical protein
VVKDVLCSFVGGQNSLKKIIGRNQTMEPLRPLLLGKDKDCVRFCNTRKQRVINRGKI